ncbi:uncharacterized protein TNCV_3656401 [Trichonephila clavipes]|nr:uncharacterized protein TNCV_3656401 [Trichonephila clavipes]
MGNLRIERKNYSYPYTQGTNRKAWVRCLMPPNTLRVHTKHVLVKSVGPKSCGLSHERRDWRIFPSPSVPCRNWGGGDRWCCHLFSFGNFAEINCTVTCMVLKANDRRTSRPLPR